MKEGERRTGPAIDAGPARCEKPDSDSYLMRRSFRVAEKVLPDAPCASTRRK